MFFRQGGTLCCLSVAMTPTPQEPSLAAEPESRASDGERIVITGMSGLYPDSYSVKELSDILYNKVNPITSENLRWNINFPDAAKYTGKAPDLNRFDAQFFKVHYLLSNCMDPMSRKVLEQVYQAIYDAGINPHYLNGKKVAVYIGTSFSESERSGFSNNKERIGCGIAGCSKTMFANRISYWLNVKGPSMSVDESCCSSLAALEQAYLAVKTGGCDAAIVGATNLFLSPHSTVHFNRLVTLAADGKTKSFDHNADGYAMSDAINVLFIQKAKDARRIHAEVKYVKTEYSSVLIGENGQQFGYIRNPQVAIQFIKQFYEEAGVSPKAVEYVEAFGSANQKADKSELEALEGVFCQNRRKPLLVGSVMSNIGYTGASSGVTAITKVLLGYHRGELAGNLHCDTPRQDIAALRDGRMRIVTEHQPFRRTYTAVNAMSITGIDAHVLLHGCYKPKDTARYKASIPHLVTLSGRMESGVTKIIEDLKSRPVDPEEIALLHNIHTSNISGHLGRGYVILDTNEEQSTVCLEEGVDYLNEAKRPLWFVYSGMGSQWVGMGAQLMRIPVFAAAIERCRRVLTPKGLDIVDIITSTEKTIFDNILHSFVGIAAIQIGLTDILRELGLVPDGIIGHSVGELGCGYADGCFTAEEMILSAYSRGLVSSETTFIRGSMAAIGKGFSEISKQCPPEIEVACHNGPDSCTISGPADAMREFVTDLTAKSIFAKEVPCSNIAFHSRYITKAGPALLSYLKDVITCPRPRSSRWVSTSVPQEKWDYPSAKYCSAEYHTNNLLSPVLFEETSKLIPSNAVVVEVAPHGLLQAILKRSLPDDCRHVPLTKRGHADNTVFLLQAIGKLHMAGFTPKVHNLYPKVEFPVSTRTPLLAHLAEWAHEEEWPVLRHNAPEKRTTATCNHIISIYDDDYSYLQGHVIGGNMTFPYAASLVAVWDTLAMSMGVAKKQQSVRFFDVYLFSQPMLHEQHQFKLTVSIQRGSKYFEVMNHNLKVVSGYVRETERVKIHNQKSDQDNCTLNVDSNTIYQLLHDRGYSYRCAFRSIECINEALSEANLLWQNNWVTFLDSILQLNMLRQQHDGLSLATYIESIHIDVSNHAMEIIELNNRTVLKAQVQEIENKTRCGGVLIKGLKFRHFPAVVKDSEALEFINVINNRSVSTKSNGDPSVAYNQKLQIASVGDFDSLYWEDAPDPTGSDVLVAVHYAGLNNYDVGRVSGEAPFKSEAHSDDNSFGMDFSGLTESGSRVMGIVRGGACSRRVRARPELLWPVPAHWSLEDAATVPLAYALAFYCLIIKSKLTPDMTILVHGGTGALGQAAISIALAYGCKVFATVSDIRKKHFLLKLFPQLKENYIGNSRDNTFGDMVNTATNGNGCNIIINCLDQQFKNTSLRCLAAYGLLLDMAQIKRHENYNFGMFNLFKSRSYITVDFSSIFDETNEKERELVQVLVSEGVARGWVRPLSRVTYAPRDAPRAFRLLAAGQHRGRVLLHLADTHADSDTQTRTIPTPIQPKLICNPNCSYVVVSSDSSLGLQFANRLIEQGARKLVLHCEKQRPHFSLKIRAWQNSGVDIAISTENLAIRKNVNRLLEDTLRSGPIEGIYLIATAINNTIDEPEVSAALANLDIVSRKLCSSIRYFGIISTNESIGMQTYLTRLLDRLPITKVTLPYQKEGYDATINYVAWRRFAVEATEYALRSAHTILRAQPREKLVSTLLQQLATIADITIPEDVADTATLGDLGIGNEKTQFIEVFLRDKHNICLSEEQILKLTIEKIKELQKTVTECDLEDVKGLHTFFSYVGSDELLSTTEMVFLPTLTSSATMEDAEFDVNETYLCIVPGMDGHHYRFKNICERIKLPALVLQPGFDRLHETIKETAERFAEVLLRKAGLKNNFYVLGYESGVLVALELVAILEQHGLTGTIFCIGNGPDEFHAVLEDQLGEYGTEEHLQDAVARHMFALIAEGKTTDLDRALHSATTWEQKVEVCVRPLLGHVAHSAQYARQLIEGAYIRIMQTRSYTVQPLPLRSRLVLIQAAGSEKSSIAMLQRYSQQPVFVHQLRAPLANAMQDLRCAAVINHHIQPEILAEFEKKNLCETYLINRDIFMTKTNLS